MNLSHLPISSLSLSTLTICVQVTLSSSLIPLWLGEISQLSCYPSFHLACLCT